MGVTIASDVSKNTNVPYSKIYEVLNSLEKKGWIETRSSRPRRYYPKSPVEALEVTRLRLQETINNWQNSVLEELQPLYDKREIREKPDVWILRGKFDTIAKVKDLFETASNELLIALPVLNESLIKAVIPLFKTFVDIKIKLFIMISKEQALNVKDLSQIGEIRVRNSMFGGGIIADSREALLILGEKKPIIIWSDHISLVKFAKVYFQYLWNTAEKVR
jgi:sugar-specific transcriptional regulator TrmB